MVGTAAVVSSGRGLARLVELAAARTWQVEATRFYFLRHGQTACNALRIFQSPDEPLDATGRAQAVDAAGWLAPEDVHSMVCSDTLRTRETAAVVAHRLGRDAVPTAALRERNFGSLIGTSSRDLDWDCAPDGGETLDAFVDRTSDALGVALASAAPVLVVAHGGTLHVLAALLGIASDASLLANARPLRFEWQAGRWMVTALGQARPLADAPNLA